MGKTIDHLSTTRIPRLELEVALSSCGVRSVYSTIVTRSHARERLKKHVRKIARLMRLCILRKKAHSILHEDQDPIFPSIVASHKRTNQEGLLATNAITMQCSSLCDDVPTSPK